MATDEAPIYEFGECRLDIRERQLRRRGQPVPLTVKGFETLRILVYPPGRLITKDDLIQQLWPDTVVGDNNLTQHISVLRRALGEERGGQRYIETVPRVGYRFVASVTASHSAGRSTSAAPP